MTWVRSAMASIQEPQVSTSARCVLGAVSKLAGGPPHFAVVQMGGPGDCWPGFEAAQVCILLRCGCVCSPAASTMVLCCGCSPTWMNLLRKTKSSSDSLACSVANS